MVPSVQHEESYITFLKKRYKNKNVYEFLTTNQLTNFYDFYSFIIVTLKANKNI